MVLYLCFLELELRVLQDFHFELCFLFYGVKLYELRPFGHNFSGNLLKKGQWMCGFKRECIADFGSLEADFLLIL